MKIINLRTSTAVALVLGTTAAYAQVQQKERGPETQGTQMQQQQERAPAARSEKGAESGTKERSSQSQSEPEGKSKTQKQAEPKDRGTKSEKQAEPRNKDKGTTQKQAEPRDKDKSSTQKSAEPRDKSQKSDKQAEPKDKGTTQKSAEPRDKAGPDRDKAAERKSDQRPTKADSGQRPQLSDQQQTRVRESVLKERGARVSSVNFSVRVGTRVPRSVHIVALPAAVIEVVPEYRSYRYFVVRDEVVIVDPDTYEIVYVLPGRSTTAGGGGGMPVALNLSEEQISFVLRNVDLKSDSRLGIGGPTVGMTIERNADLRPFPSMVVEKLPELREFRYLVTENDVAFVEPNDMKVVLVTPIQR